MYKSIFSYYGGKSKLAHLYPTPTQSLVIEPFAGAGAYSYRHCQKSMGRTAWINEPDPTVRSIWEFLLSPDAGEWIHSRWPESVHAGERASEILAGCPAGLVALGQAEANQGTQGATGVHDQITSMAEKVWPRLKSKFLTIIPQISHWSLTSRDYTQITNRDATWFIDPPYSGTAGSRYRSGNALDYGSLARWCRDRAGQVIVTENQGADWLPFQPIEHPRVSIRSRYQLANAQEVMWTCG